MDLAELDYDLPAGAIAQRPAEPRDAARLLVDAPLAGGAIAHRTVEEVWYVTAGRGQVWRKQGGLELVVDVAPGTALTIPTGVHFQFRTIGPEPLCFVMCTMPPWPGENEAFEVEGNWIPTIRR